MNDNKTEVTTKKESTSFLIIRALADPKYSLIPALAFVLIGLMAVQRIVDGSGLHIQFGIMIAYCVLAVPVLVVNYFKKSSRKVRDEDSHANPKLPLLSGKISILLQLILVMCFTALLVIQASGLASQAFGFGELVQLTLIMGLILIMCFTAVSAILVSQEVGSGEPIQVLSDEEPRGIDSELQR